MKSVGDRIKERRKALGLSAEQLGELTGKDRATIYRYENGGIENMPITILEPLAKALRTTPDFLMGWTDDPTEDKALINAYRAADPSVQKVVRIMLKLEK